MNKLSKSLAQLEEMGLETTLLRVKSTHKPEKIEITKEQAQALLLLLDLSKSIDEEL